jgi:glycosyltransferase involved in cell wall biosynthesis
MPVRNEVDHIERSLGAVLAQDYPPDKVEILVIDAMSTDGTRETVLRLKAGRSALHLLDNPRKSAPSALNIGIRASMGEVVLRVDGHTIIEPDYIRQCIAVLHRTGASNVGGSMRAEGLTEFGKAVAVVTSSRFGIGGAKFHYLKEEAIVDTVYMGAWPRSVFEQIGLFDEEMVRNQDDEFNFRLRAKGGKIVLSPSIRSMYFNRSTPIDLMKQYFQYGFWKIRVLQKHPRQMRIYHFAPLGLVFGLFLSLNASIFAHKYLVVFASLLVLYAGAGLASVAGLSGLSGLRQRLSAMSAAPMMHLSYGSGFLIGAIWFAYKWYGFLKEHWLKRL